MVLVIHARPVLNAVSTDKSHCVLEVREHENVISSDDLYRGEGNSCKRAHN